MNPVLLSLRRIIARLLAMVVLVLGLMDPMLALAETMDECAPEWCVSSDQGRHFEPLNALTAFDGGDESTDLEQLLRPRARRSTPNQQPGADYPLPAILQAPPAAPPLLRPPIFHS